MRMIESINVTSGMMTSSSIPETDAPPWESAATYVQGERVRQNHRVYESVQSGNTNHDPSADVTRTWWVDVGATNRWRAFDQLLTPLATLSTGNINYVITLTSRIDSIAMFGLIGSDVRIVTKDGLGVTQYDKTFPLASTRTITGWWDYFFEPFTTTPSLIAWDVPAFTGWTVDITISGAGTRAVGEILLGTNITLGDTLVDTTLGVQDFSIKERDQWGGWQIVERGYSNTVDYRFMIPQDDVGRVRRVIARNRARMCVYSAGPNTDMFGTTVVGFVNLDGLSIPITTNYCFATLSVESLTEE